MVERYRMVQKITGIQTPPPVLPLVWQRQFKQVIVKVSVCGSKGKSLCSLLLFLTDRLFVWIESEAIAWPLLPHANEISTAAVSVLRLILVTAAGWSALCRHQSPSLIARASSISSGKTAQLHSEAVRELYEWRNKKAREQSQCLGTQFMIMNIKNHLLVYFAEQERYPISSVRCLNANEFLHTRSV